MFIFLLLHSFKTTNMTRTLKYQNKRTIKSLSINLKTMPCKLFVLITKIWNLPKTFAHLYPGCKLKPCRGCIGCMCPAWGSTTNQGILLNEQARTREVASYIYRSGEEKTSEFKPVLLLIRDQILILYSLVLGTGVQSKNE